MMRLPAVFIFVLCVICHGARADLEKVRYDSGKVAAVVFVHGIVGDQTTWDNLHPGDPSWLQKVAGEGLFDDLNIFSFSYPSEFFGSTVTTSQIADKLKEQLAGLDVDKHERIVFVAHSLGTIITTKLLLTHRDIAKRTKAVFFYSPPFAGSQLAAALRLIPRSSALISDLSGMPSESSRDGFLLRLRNQWRNSRLAMQIPVYCAYETLMTPPPGVSRLIFAARVVEPDSAERLCTAAFLPVQRHHMNIVRPDGDRPFISHEYLRNWYTEVFPFAARSSEPGAQIVMADCTVDRYGNDFKAAMFDDVANATGGRMSLTRRLPENWRPANSPLLWDARRPPRLLLIHFSCFQQGQEANSAISNRERADDFAALLATLRDSDVRILAFSRAFAEEGGQAYLFNYPIAAELRDQGRLFTLATFHANAYAQDSVQRENFKALLKSILAGAPPPPSPSCRC